jgi:multidrug efflux system membrane fusion protein
MIYAPAEEPKTEIAGGPGRSRGGPPFGAAAALAGLALMAGCSGTGAVSKGAGQKKGDLAMPVAVAQVARKDVPVEIQIIGNVEAYSTITVKAQAGGELMKVSFKEGDYVKKGDLLFSIDPRPLQAQLSQALANNAKAKALLGQAEANLSRDTAQAQYLKAQSERIADLVRQGILSRDQGEQTKSAADATSQTLNADRAAIESARAEIAATQAAVENLRLQFGYTEIRSPLDGRTGNVMVKQGNIVSANGADLVTINQVEPIYVTFAVPESQMMAVKNHLAAGRIQVAATPQDNASAKETGELTFTDNAVDATTGTIKMKATFGNADHQLWPGQFVRVVVRLATERGALVVPNQAVQSGQEGPYVLVVKSDRTVESRPVTTGTRVGEELVIDKGLEAGETVVTEGHLRLTTGSRVAVRDGRGGPGGGKGQGKGEGKGKRGE